ncbi:MAG: hypothetical protein SP4CHLAM5_03550 [Chlamydiia bacterium]|nr:hypothetical protein [Chlamydiia bacterium]MCH9618229.1 hypothetical protein [Chlamydiia bacterium]MCH9624048.1 hypothetical protein [Chlamydiia bacterium]
MKKSIFTVMSDPRGFIRAIPRKKIGTMPIFLAWVIGVVYLLREATALQASNSYGFWLILLVSVVLAIPVAYIGMYVFAFFLFWSGKLFKGKGTYKEIFTAAAFGRVPEFFVLLSWFFLLTYFGKEAFDWQAMGASGSLYVAALMIAQLVFYVWGFVISLHTVGEVQKFSAWMSLWNYILAYLLILIVSLFLEFLVAVIFSLHLGGVDTVSKGVSLII